MRDVGKRNILGVLVDALDYDAAVEKIIDAAKSSRPYSATALAVHGVMTGVTDRTHRYRLNHMDLVTPDGQPVRWGLNLLYQARLNDRVYGPKLMLRACAAAAEEGLPVYLYGSKGEVVSRLALRLREKVPSLEVVGAEASKFRRISLDESRELVKRIRASGAKITFVGLGCPRQEVFVHEYRDALSMPVIAVGAAFDYHSGNLKEPSETVQRLGLQWMTRLAQNPRRLWRRYLIQSPFYLALLFAQAMRIWRPDPSEASAPDVNWLYG